MDVLVRDVPEQTVITEQRMVDQAALVSCVEPLFAGANAHICDVAIPLAAPSASG